MKDFLYTLDEICFGKKIYIYPSTMQGNTAPDEIQKAIILANKHNIVEIIVMIRGGGSKEDLECFNTKKVAVSIFKSNIPIVTGIGHQIDTSLADLVSHKCFITPTATAQKITIHNKISKNLITNKIRMVQYYISRKLNQLYEYLHHQHTELEKYKKQIIIQLNNNPFKTFYNQKKHLAITRINNHYDFIIQSRIDIHQIMIDNLVQDLTKRKYNFSCYTGKIENYINRYRQEYDNISRPKIISNDTEVLTLSEFKKLKTYRIVFVDGTSSEQIIEKC